MEASAQGDKCEEKVESEAENDFSAEDNSEQFAAENMHRLAVAPMLEITHSHFRTFMRLLSRQTTLWTEMIHSDAILHSTQVEELLGFNAVEKPLVLQLGGNCPERLGEAARIAARFGYAELNLNCGCPSPRVTEGCFGACLMRSPKLVAECLTRMAEAGLPCSVKCRTGVDDDDDYAFLHRFVEVVARDSPCRLFVVHARKAYLSGLNPKENRTVPPLNHAVVHRLVEDFPQLAFVLNGGVRTLAEAEVHLRLPGIKGVMIGRGAADNVWQFADADRALLNRTNPARSPAEVLRLFGAYCDRVRAQRRVHPFTLLKPALSLFAGQRGTAHYKQLLSDKRRVEEAGSLRALLEQALALVAAENPAALAAPPGG